MSSTQRDSSESLAAPSPAPATRRASKPRNKAAGSGVGSRVIISDCSGTAAEIVAIIGNEGITKASSFDARVSGDAAAEDLDRIAAANGAGSVDATGLVTIRGGTEELVKVLRHPRVTLPAGLDAVITGPAQGSEITALRDACGTGVLDGSGVTRIAGTGAGVLEALNCLNVAPHRFEPVLSGLAAATDILDLRARTTDRVEATGVTEIKGTASDIVQVLADTGVARPDRMRSIIEGTGAAVEHLIALERAAGMESVDAGGLSEISGTASGLVLLIHAASIAKPRAFKVILTGEASAADLATLVKAGGIEFVGGFGGVAIVGSAAEILALTDDARHRGPVSFKAAITGESTVADLATIRARSGGAIDACGLRRVSGPAARILAMLGDPGFTWPPRFVCHLTGTATAGEVAGLRGACGGGGMDCTDLSEISGTATEILEAIDLSSVHRGGRLRARISGAAGVAEVATLASAFGPNCVDCADLTGVRGAAPDIIGVLRDSGIAMPGRVDVMLEGAADAQDIAAIRAVCGAGSVRGDALAEIVGTAAEVVALINDAGFVKPAGCRIRLRGDATTSDVVAIQRNPLCGALDASGLGTLRGGARETCSLIGDPGIVKPEVLRCVLVGQAEADHLLEIRRACAGAVVDGSALDEIAGSAVSIAALLTDPAATWPERFGCRVAGAATWADIDAILQASHGGGIDATDLTEVVGTAEELVAFVSSPGIARPSDFDATVQGVAEAEHVGRVWQAAGRGRLDCSGVPEIRGTAVEILTLLEEMGTVWSQDLKCAIDGLASAEEVSRIRVAVGRGSIDCTGLEELSGTGPEIVAVLEDTAIVDKADVRLRIVGPATAADIAKIQAFGSSSLGEDDIADAEDLQPNSDARADAADESVRVDADLSRAGHAGAASPPARELAALPAGKPEAAPPAISYLAHFGLGREPFSIVPDPLAMFLSSNHEQAWEDLLFGVQQGSGGFVVLTGKVGSGKTMLSRYLRDRMPPDVLPAWIRNPRVNADELLVSICKELGLDVGAEGSRGPAEPSLVEPPGKGAPVIAPERPEAAPGSSLARGSVEPSLGAAAPGMDASTWSDGAFADPAIDALPAAAWSERVEPALQLGSHRFFEALRTFLLQQHAVGKRCVVIIDEAQSLVDDALDQLRHLTNIETDERKLLQVVLIGQPELGPRLRGPGKDQFEQRVIAWPKLDGLSEAETGRYVLHRMRYAGLQGDLPFDAAALRQIYRLTRGVPRQINRLCEFALLKAYAQYARVVDAGMAQKAWAQLHGRDDVSAGSGAGSRSVPGSRWFQAITRRLGTLASWRWGKH